MQDQPKATKADAPKQAIIARQKSVTQYSRTGKRMRTFESLAAAQRATGIPSVSIGSVASGKNVRAGGYFWRWEMVDKIDVSAFLSARQKVNRTRNGTKITQYSLSGKRIATYASAEEAQEATGADAGAIRRVLYGQFKSAKGFFWKEGHGPKKIDLSKHKFGRESMASTQSKRVAKCTSRGKYVKIYDSVTAAAKAAKVNISTMSSACRGIQHTCKGWRWKFV